MCVRAHRTAEVAQAAAGLEPPSAGDEGDFRGISVGDIARRSAFVLPATHAASSLGRLRSVFSE